MAQAPLDVSTLFTVQGKVVVLTGGSGVLGRAMAQGLARAGAKVAILSLHEETAGRVSEAIRAEGGQALGVACDVLDRPALERAQEQVLSAFGALDVLVNAAGGNHPQATTSGEHTFFDLGAEAIHKVFSLNIMGTVLASQVFGRTMAEQRHGVIVNIASASSLRPLTRVVAYSAAKAAVVNFTQWLAVHMAQEYDPRIRVNCIAPGFFLTEQNRYLLTDAQSGAMTPRGQTILNHTPAGRFGQPEDLLGTLLWLVSPASAFVTGVTIPVDGGFASFSGV